MMTEEQKLGLELRFRPKNSAAVWSGLFASLLAWEPRLQPTHVEKPSHRYLQEPEPWTPEMVAELADKCAGKERFVWTLLGVDEGFAMSFERRLVEVAVSIAMPRPSAPLPSFFLTLLDALQGSIQPSLAMLFDLYSNQDAKAVWQGLRSLGDVPPILYLDEWAVERAGGRERLHNAPCEVLDMPDGGLLLIIRLSLWDAPTAADIERKQAVEQHLGVSKERPLLFIEPDS